MAQARGSSGSSGFDDARRFWDQRYSAPEYIFGTEPNAFLVTQRHLFRPGDRVLEIACGEGRNAVWLAGLGCDVVALDISPLALAKARQLAQARGVAISWHEADVRTWDWQPQSFNAIVSIFIQFAAPEGRAQIFQGLQRALRPGGYLLLQGFTPRQLQYTSGGPREPAHLYTRELLEQSFPQLEIQHLSEHDDVLAEGSKHVGMAALIDLLARNPPE